MGTGVGEAMLIGAAVGATAGGAGAAIQGGDPLKGALTGGAMGAVGGGIGGAMGAAPVAGMDSAAIAAGGGGGGFVPAAGSGASFALPAAGTTGAVGGGAGAGADVFAGYSPTGSSAATMTNAANTGAGISGVQAGSGTLGSAGFTPPPANAGIAGAQSPVTNVFGQAAGTPGYLSNTQLGMTGATAGLSGAMQAERAKLGTPPNEKYDGPLSKLKYDPDKFTASTPQYAPTSVYHPTYAAEGGIMQSYRSGGYNDNADYDDSVGTDNLNDGGIAHFDVGGMAFTGMPTNINIGSGYQGTPESLAPRGLEALMGVRKKKDSAKEMMDSAKLQGLTPRAYLDVYGEGIKSQQQMASGGISSLGGYSDGGRMLKGPGDGMSDNIPATIGGKQPARLADGEFVVPADVVSHLGNGSTDAGAKQLYSMMERVRKARTGNKKQGKQIKPAKYMVA